PTPPCPRPQRRSATARSRRANARAERREGTSPRSDTLGCANSRLPPNAGGGVRRRAIPEEPDMVSCLLFVLYALHLHPAPTTFTVTPSTPRTSPPIVKPIGSSGCEVDPDGHLRCKP